MWSDLSLTAALLTLFIGRSEIKLYVLHVHQIRLIASCLLLVAQIALVNVLPEYLSQNPQVSVPLQFIQAMDASMQGLQEKAFSQNKCTHTQGWVIGSDQDAKEAL